MRPHQGSVEKKMICLPLEALEVKSRCAVFPVFIDVINIFALINSLISLYIIFKNFLSKYFAEVFCYVFLTVQKQQ